MTQTVYGVALDAVGHARDGGRYWSTPSGLLRTVQDPNIRVDVEHGSEHCGQVVYIERARDGQVWLVAEVDDTVQPETLVRIYPPPPTTPLEIAKPGPELRSVPTDYYWSVARIGGPEHGYVLAGVALTTSPARVGARPVVFRDGNPHMAAYTSSDSFERQLLHRAAEAQLKRHGGPILVRDAGPQPHQPTGEHERSSGIQIETRAAELGDVSVGRREITAIVAPYESPAVVSIKGKRVYEMFLPGCFDDVPKQPGTIRLNRDHKPEKVCGRAIAWDTRRPDGLVATFKVSKTHDGDEVLELAAEDCLDCSVGFGATRESWPQPDMRLIDEGFIDHVAVTSAPAYRDARVLDVRRDLAGVG